jgi:hypothetical protein
MPQGEDVLGFSNPWYEHAIETAANPRARHLEQQIDTIIAPSAA